VLAVLLLSAPATAAESLSPADHLALRLEADAKYSANDLEGAAALYRRIYEAYPADGEATYRLGRSLFLLGRADEALGYGMEALEQGFADEQSTSYSIAQVLARQGKTEDALRWISRALASPLEDRPGLMSDEAFGKIRTDPRFLGLAGTLPAGEFDRVRGWRHDLDFFLIEARRLHASPSRPAWDPSFETEQIRLKERVPELDDAAIVVELQKLVAARLADGHSVVNPMPTRRLRFAMLPVHFHFFSDGLFVVGADAGHENLVGRRVLAIGGKPVDAITEDLRRLVSRDNDQGILWLGPQYLASPAMLRAMGYATSLDRVPLTVQGDAGPQEVELVAGAHHPRRGLASAPGPTASTPRWLARAGEPYWQETLGSWNAVYVQFNQVRNAESGASIAAFARAVRDSLARGDRKTLILDLRHNGGGNNFLIWPIVRLVSWHQVSGQGHRTFVITGRGTFSACQNLVNHIDRATDAIFVGEPSSSKPNFTGEDTSVELPWSGLRLSISSRWWQDSYPSDKRPYVAVSMPVALSSADWKAGRDPVLDALGEFLRRAPTPAR
jgi:hypothetical protein